MIRHLLTLTTVFSLMTACGTERPDPSDYRSTPATATSQTPAKTGTTSGTNTMTSPNPTDNKTAAPAPDAKPATPATPAAPAKAPIRTLVNAAEIAAAQAAYGTDCAGCHMALATSAKKGRTKLAISGAINIAPHANVKARWPADVADTTDDGVDQASLKLSAMEQALK